jgi:hypothetical protein
MTCYIGLIVLEEIQNKIKFDFTIKELEYFLDAHK